MLTAYLAGTGGQVRIPDAVAVVPGPTENDVLFVDARGKVVVQFRRRDVALYKDGDSDGLAEAAAGGDGAVRT